MAWRVWGDINCLNVAGTCTVRLQMKGDPPGGHTPRGLESWVTIWADFGFDQIGLAPAWRMDLRTRKKGEEL